MLNSYFSCSNITSLVLLMINEIQIKNHLKKPQADFLPNIVTVSFMFLGIIYVLHYKCIESNSYIVMGKSCKVNMRKWHHKQLDLRPLESIPYAHPRSNFVVMCRVFRIARVDMHWQLASLKLACHRVVTGNESRYLQDVFICHLNMH